MLFVINGGRSTAPGADGVTYDILNCLASVPYGPLLALFNMSYEEGRLPRGWKRAIIIPIPKGNGKFRPISLTSCFCKMMERIVLNRLQYQIGDKLSSNLYGFIRGKSTSDCINRYLSATDVKCRAFIDLQGAFDKVCGSVILNELPGMGVQGKLLTWIADYLHDRRAQVWFQGFLSEERSFQLGTPQGGVLSPTLFNVVMNRVASACYPGGVDVVVYADDIMLQGKTISQLQRAMTILDGMCKSLGLVINREKTKFQSTSANATLNIGGRALERVQSYKYLGVYVGFGSAFKDAEVNHLLTRLLLRLGWGPALAFLY